MCRPKQSDDSKDSVQSVQPRTFKKKAARASTSTSSTYRRYRKSAEFVICKLPFNRLAKQIAKSLEKDVRFKPCAIKALRECTEAYLVTMFEDSKKYASCARRVTIMPEDIRRAVRSVGTFTNCKY